MSEITYAHGSIADKCYPVTEAPRVGGDTIRVGAAYTALGHIITAIEFYTGFAGCPPRYYITTRDPRTGRPACWVMPA
jgi:hypothetical protein